MWGGRCSLRNRENVPEAALSSRSARRLCSDRAGVLAPDPRLVRPQIFPERLAASEALRAQPGLGGGSGPEPAATRTLAPRASRPGEPAPRVGSPRLPGDAGAGDPRTSEQKEEPPPLPERRGVSEVAQLVSAPGRDPRVLPARREATSGGQHLARVLPAPSTLSSTAAAERAGGEHLPRCPLGVSLGSRMTAGRGLGSFFQTFTFPSLPPCLGHKHSKILRARHFCFLAKWPSLFSPCPCLRHGPPPLVWACHWQRPAGAPLTRPRASAVEAPRGRPRARERPARPGASRASLRQ